MGNGIGGGDDNLGPALLAAIWEAVAMTKRTYKVRLVLD